MRNRTAQVVFPLPKCISLDQTIKQQLRDQPMIFARVYRGGIHLYWQGRRKPLILHVTQNRSKGWGIDVLDNLSGNEEYLVTKPDQLEYLLLLPEGCAIELEKYSNLNELFKEVLPNLTQPGVEPKQVIENYLAERLCKDKTLVMIAQLRSHEVDAAVALTPMSASSEVDAWVGRFHAQLALEVEAPTAVTPKAARTCVDRIDDESRCEHDAVLQPEARAVSNSGAWFGRFFTLATIGAAAAVVISSVPRSGNRP